MASPLDGLIAGALQGRGGGPGPSTTPGTGRGSGAGGGFLNSPAAEILGSEDFLTLLQLLPNVLGGAMLGGTPLPEEEQDPRILALMDAMELGGPGETFQGRFGDPTISGPYQAPPGASVMGARRFVQDMPDETLPLALAGLGSLGLSLAVPASAPWALRLGLPALGAAVGGGIGEVAHDQLINPEPTDTATSVQDALNRALTEGGYDLAFGAVPAVPGAMKAVKGLLNARRIDAPLWFQTEEAFSEMARLLNTQGGFSRSGMSGVDVPEGLAVANRFNTDPTVLRVPVPQGGYQPGQLESYLRAWSQQPDVVDVSRLPRGKDSSVGDFMVGGWRETDDVGRQWDVIESSTMMGPTREEIASEAARMVAKKRVQIDTGLVGDDGRPILRTVSAATLSPEELRRQAHMKLIRDNDLMRDASLFGQETQQRALYDVVMGVEQPVAGTYRTVDEFIRSPEFEQRIQDLATIGRAVMRHQRRNVSAEGKALQKGTNWTRADRRAMERSMRQGLSDWWTLYGTQLENFYPGVPIRKVAGFLASTANRTTPEDNLRQASEYIRRLIKGEPIIQPNFRMGTQATDPGGIAVSRPGSMMPFESKSRRANLLATEQDLIEMISSDKLNDMAGNLLGRRGIPQGQFGNTAVIDTHIAKPAEDYGLIPPVKPARGWGDVSRSSRPKGAQGARDNPFGRGIYLGPEAARPTAVGIPGTASELAKSRQTPRGLTRMNQATGKYEPWVPNYATIQNSVIRVAERMGVDVRIYSAWVWEGIRSSIKEYGHVYGTPYGSHTVPSEVGGFARLWPQMIKDKAGKLGITVKELERRLKNGDANLLSALLATPVGLAAYQRWLESQGIDPDKQQAFFEANAQGG